MSREMQYIGAGGALQRHRPSNLGSVKRRGVHMATYPLPCQATALAEPLNDHQAPFLKVPFHTNYCHMDAINRMSLTFRPRDSMACGKGRKHCGLGSCRTRKF